MDINEFVKTYFRLYYHLKPNKQIILQTHYGDFYKITDFEIIPNVEVIKLWIKSKNKDDILYVNFRDIRDVFDMFSL